MAYIGNTPAEAYTSIAKQDITGNGGTSYTLDHAVANENEIEVFVNNVRQEPSVAYTVSGTALTMTGDVEASDDFYVVFQGKAISTTSHPEGHDLKARDGTFSGDLAVDTDTLYVDSTNDHVGIGTTSIATLGSQHSTLQINGKNTSNAGALRLRSTDNSVDSALWASSTATYLATISNDPLHLRTNNTDRLIINGDGSWGKAPAGTVLQTKSASYTGAYSSTSTNWTTISGMSVTITPRSSTSKFLIMYHISGNANTRYWSLTAFRGSTAINRGGASGSRERISTPTGANNGEPNQQHVQRSVADAYIDSPNTTSSITYTVRGRIHYNTGTFYINRDQADDNYSYAKRATSNLIVMEIAG